MGYLRGLRHPSPCRVFQSMDFLPSRRFGSARLVHDHEGNGPEVDEGLKVDAMLMKRRGKEQIQSRCWLGLRETEKKWSREGDKRGT